MHDKHMNFSFSSALITNKELETLAEKLFNKHELFSVTNATAEFTSKARKLPSSSESHLYIENLKLCFHSILYVNTVMDRISSLAKTHYNPNDAQHTALLHSLWSKLKPDERVGAWGDLGFQGSDPATDFRGMGLLGLVQLEFLSDKPIAREILLDSGHPRRYYPFAATGINFSAFVLELLSEGRLHQRLFAKVEANESQYVVTSEGGPAANEQLVALGCREVHEVYCRVYETFFHRWVTADPLNIMAFPGIYKTLKDHLRGEMPALKYSHS